MSKGEYTMNNLTEGSVFKLLIKFSVPYLIACFLQTFYGMADLYITGQYNPAAIISAVSIGSQVMHMITVVLAALTLGVTIAISQSVGAKKDRDAGKAIGNSVGLFMIISFFMTILLMFGVNMILNLLETPAESVSAARDYLLICFAGIPMITAYNVIAGIFRGMGDTKTPMVLIFIAGVLNIIGDIILIGPCHMGAAGAAIATVASQSVSVILSLIFLLSGKYPLPVRREDLRLTKPTISRILSVGVPVAFQDGFIQISFLIITRIANSRGVDVSAAVGIVEKIITFLFLVPSSMMSSVSVISAQNAGAKKHERSKEAMRIGMAVSFVFGLSVHLICQFAASSIITLFIHDDANVVTLGAQYLRSYSLDCAFAGIQFCFSGFFNAYNRSFFSFIHNVISVLCVRIPATWLAGRYFPQTLYPMGLAAPMGALLSSLICLYLYKTHKPYWES